MSIARIHAAIAAGAIAALAPSCLAGLVTIGPFDLTPDQQNPPAASTAFGTATLMLDPINGNFQLDYSYSGLSSPVIMAHFHQAPVGENGGVVYWLATAGAPNNLATTLLNPSLQTGLTADTASGGGFLSPGLVDAALTGLLYINIHTENFPSGEIRGQVVPTPGAAALLGLSSLVAVARRRRS